MKTGFVEDAYNEALQEHAETQAMVDPKYGNAVHRTVDQNIASLIF